jgi:hypothetical protein
LALAAPAQAATRRVLFLGNSYTDVNDLPETLNRLARSVGDEVRHDRSTPGGFRFKDHAASEESLRRLDAGGWDAIVLQEQSQSPGFDDAQIETDVAPFASALVKRGRAASPHSRLVFYETWGRREGDAANCKEIPAVCTFAGQQARITRTYERLAERVGGEVVPVGAAWARLRRERPEVALYGGDGSHPSTEGTYLAACALYAALFRKPLGRLSPLSLPPERAQLLQRYAQEAVFARRRLTSPRAP